MFYPALPSPISPFVAAALPMQPSSLKLATFTPILLGAFIIPAPVNTGKIGGTFVRGPMPPTVLPSALAARTSKVATPAAPPMPSMVPPTATTSNVSFAPTPLAVAAQNPAKIVNPYTTQDAIYSQFRIVSPRPGSGK